LFVESELVFAGATTLRSAKTSMTRFLSLALLAILLIGCKKQPTSETIEADHELNIVRNGKPLVSVKPYVSRYGDGNEVRVHCPNGEEVWLHVDPLGGASTVYVQRTKVDGSAVHFEFHPDGRLINRSEHPLGTLPGDDGFKSDPTAEQAAPSNGG
jgi:hypothetical protein